MYLMWKDKKQFVICHFKVMKVHTLVSDAFTHQKKKVIRFAAVNTVFFKRYGRNMSKGGGNKKDRENVVLFINVRVMC